MSITIKSLQKPETKRALKRADLFNEQRRSKDILKTMDEDTYEEMVASWAYWCLKENDGRRYEDVMVNVLFPASGNQYKCLPLWQKTKVHKVMSVRNPNYQQVHDLYELCSDGRSLQEFCRMSGVSYQKYLES